MNTNRMFGRMWKSLLLIFLVVPSWLMAHEGEDHGTAQPEPVNTPEAATNQLTTSGQTERFELLIKYPPPEKGEGTRLQLFLADYRTNQPITGATFALSFKPAGVKINRAPAMLSPGIYELIAQFPEDTSYNLVATVGAGDRTDFIEVRNIYAGDVAARFLAEHSVGAIPDGAADQDSSSLWKIILISLGVILLGAIAIVAIKRRRTARSITRAVGGKENKKDAGHRPIPKES